MGDLFKYIADYYVNEWLTNPVGLIIMVLTMLFAACGMMFKDMRAILISQIVANGLLAAQCILSNKISSGGIVILATVQTVISFVISYNKKKFPIWLTLIFMAGFSAITLVSFFAPDIPSTPFDFITMVAGWFFALTIVQEKSWICRIYGFINTVLWIVFEILTMPIQIISHLVIIGFITVAIIRNDRAEWASVFRKIFVKKKAENLPEEEKETEEV